MHYLKERQLRRVQIFIKVATPVLTYASEPWTLLGKGRMKTEVTGTRFFVFITVQRWITYKINIYRKVKYESREQKNRTETIDIMWACKEKTSPIRRVLEQGLSEKNIGWVKKDMVRRIAERRGSVAGSHAEQEEVVRNMKKIIWGHLNFNYMPCNHKG